MNNALTWIRSSPAQIVFLVAPAGYGKSTLAQALRREYERFSTCDCVDAATPRSFSQRVLAALSHENPENAEYYSELQMRLTSLDDEAECSQILEQAWRLCN